MIEPVPTSKNMEDKLINERAVTMVHTVGEYDVLLPQTEIRASNTTSQLDGHTGNMRFNIFLDTNKHMFDRADGRGDIEECRRIASYVVRSVHHACQGRFLQMTSDGYWQELDKDTARDSVLLAFRMKQSWREQQSVDTEYNRTSTMQEQQSVCTEYNRTSRESFSEASLSSTNSRHSSMSEEQSNDSKMPSYSSGGIPLTEISPNDVLCGGKGEGVLPTTNVGNNRFRVMRDMRRARFDQSNREGRLSIIAEMTHVVQYQSEPPGRFLIENPGTRLWHEINSTKAMAKALRAFERSEIERKRSMALKLLREKVQKKKAAGKLRHQSDTPQEKLVVGKNGPPNGIDLNCDDEPKSLTNKAA